MQTHFDIIIIGGGATGLGTAVEAASRGYSTLLLEAHDYGKGTSSKSTKLVHGGIRYLANLDFALVQEGLEERFYFLQNAPHLARRQSYLIPLSNWRERIKYWLGIKIYDRLAGKRKIGPSKFLDHAATLAAAPDLNAAKISGGAIYYDGQFDDTRLLITLLKTFENLGGCALNYHAVEEFRYAENGQIKGVVARNSLQNQSIEFSAKVVINATGTLSDRLLNLAEPSVEHHTVAAAQGTHLVFDKEIFDSEHAILVPETSDGRVLFILPWHNHIVVGTTDVKVEQPSIEPIAQEQEIDFILATLNAYGCREVSRKDIKSVFCGQRPLVKPANAQNTAKISRKHEIMQTSNGLVTIVGGKWTIYRRMGEDTINHIEQQFGWAKSSSRTRNLKLFGAESPTIESYPLQSYGTAAIEIRRIQQLQNNFGLLHPDLPYWQAEVIYQARHEQAKSVEDVLARRTRAILLDCTSAIAAAPLVAKLLAAELGHDKHWQAAQVAQFNEFATNYSVTHLGI